MYLLDSEVVAELRQARVGAADAGLVAWAAGKARASLFLSAIGLLELEAAAATAETRDKARGAILRRWIEGQVLPAFEGRILPVDAAVVRRRGQLAYTNTRDGLIAATALEHGLTLVTRHVGTFRAGRVKLFNPWGYSPDAGEGADDWREATRARPVWLRNLFVRA